MESRSFGSRGIQQDDVWSAADSLIADGLRPTIERVRQKIGRGSPNTVSPMLEAWFATLGLRLGVNKSEGDFSDVPEILQRALKDAWEIALTKSREKSALETEQATSALNLREIEIEQAEALREVQRQALLVALKAADKSTEDAIARLTAAQALTARRETENQNLQARLASVETERDLERRRIQDVIANLHLERQKIDERAQATQRKLLEEIDRARQETKKITGEAQAAARQFATEKTRQEELNRTCEKDLARIQALHAASSADTASLRQALAASDSRAHALQNFLRSQLDDSTSTITRLTDALLNQGERPATGPRFLAGKVKRAIRIRKA